jgi:spore coat polysaccharide biosynthesis protein SpsF (cytidylyltransferase family)
MGASINSAPQEYIIRVCADNPFISGELLTDMTNFCLRKNFEFVHTLSKPPTYPYIDGMGAEIFTRNILCSLDYLVTDMALREHVTLAVHRGNTSISSVGMPTPGKYYSENLKIDIDTPEDYSRILHTIKQYELTPYSSDLEIIEAFSK